MNSEYFNIRSAHMSLDMWIIYRHVLNVLKQLNTKYIFYTISNSEGIFSYL